MRIYANENIIEYIKSKQAMSLNNSRYVLIGISYAK